MPWNRRSAAFGWGRHASGFRGVGGGAAYDPSQEAGYLLDFWASDSDSITEEGTGVSSWVDRASGVDVTQGTDANRPTYQATGLGGKPAVLFVLANDDGLTNAAFANAATSYTLYVFADAKSAPATNSYVLDSQTGRLRFDQGSGGGGAQVGYRDTTSLKSIAASATGAQVLTWTLDAGTTTGEVYRGSTSLGTDAYAASSMGGQLGLCSFYTGTLNTFDAAVGRLLVYTGVHDAATRSRVWNWGASYYGISL